ncbi:MAG: T9SS type A sorting domain-containing protein [Bacteroidales bacterium]
MPGDIITNAEETPDPDDHDVLVYPVPFTNEINIETYRKALTFSLFSTAGECFVLNKNLSVPNTELETSHLNRGAYIYKISDNGKTIHTGKIIKK